MPPSRCAGSVSRSGSHGNRLHLAGGPTSCALFCSAEGCLWPITSLPQFGPCPQLAEPDMTVGTGSAEIDPKRLSASKLFALRDASLLDHFVSGRQQRFRDGEAEGFGGF